MKIKIRSYDNELYNFDVDKTTGAVPSLIYQYPNILALKYKKDNDDIWSL